MEAAGDRAEEKHGYAEGDGHCGIFDGNCVTYDRDGVTYDRDGVPFYYGSAAVARVGT